MPSIGPFHPQIVHFVVALLFAGVAFRVISLTGRFKFAGPAAATLILVGTLAAFAAVQSGTQAHGPVERIPGARLAVQEHEEWGQRARNIFVVVSALELLGVGLLAMKSRYAKLGLAVSALVGLAALGVLYEAAEHGGTLVYSYAGGPGLRTGNPDDVGRLFAAGVYQQAMQDRQAGRRAEAADLIDLAVRRFPNDVDWQLLVADSLIQDRKDPQAALARLSQIKVADDDARLRLRVGTLKATAQQAAGDLDGARATLEALKTQFPTNPQIQRRLDDLQKRP
jgi:uncharacterized membrane protein